MPRTVTYTNGSGLVEITVLAGPPRPDAEEARHHAFITDHWPGLGAAAFDGFQRFGIGAVVVEERPAQHAADHPFVAHQISFAASHGPWMRNGLPRPTATAVADALEVYDPRETGVIVVTGEAAPRAYRVGGTLPPKEAFAQARRAFN